MSDGIPRQSAPSNFTFARRCIMAGELALGRKHMVRACLADPGNRLYFSHLAVESDRLDLSRNWAVATSRGPCADEVMRGLGTGLSQFVIELPDVEVRYLQRFAASLACRGVIYVDYETISSQDEPVDSGDILRGRPPEPGYSIKVKRNLMRALTKFHAAPQGIPLEIQGILDPDEKRRRIGEAVFSTLIFIGDAAARRTNAWETRIETERGRTIGVGYTKLPSGQNLDTQAARLLGKELGLALSSALAKRPGPPAPERRPYPMQDSPADRDDVEAVKLLWTAHAQRDARLQSLRALAIGPQPQRTAVLQQLQAASSRLDAAEGSTQKSEGSDGPETSWVKCVTEALKAVR
jgi:hypothetical protein